MSPEAPESASRGRWTTQALASLRLRYTLCATLLAAVTFVGGGAIALTFYHDSLVDEVNHGSHDTASGVAAGVTYGEMVVPIPMPVAAGVPRIQILDAAGKVISGDPSSYKDPPFAAPLSATGPKERITSLTDSPYLPEHHTSLVAERATTPLGAVETVVVAQSLDTADARTSQAVELSAIIGAASVAMVAAVAWLAVGRTLRRVERLRAQVLAVTASGDLSRQVPQSGADELARLGATLNAMLAALARSAERQRRFVADAAHELRTPIAGLNASIDVAARHTELARDPGWFGELSDGHRRLGRLVDDLLVLAGLDENAPRRHTPVDLAGVIADAARRRTPPGVRIEAEQAAEPITVLGDQTQLERIVANLVDNAVRHAHSIVRITLTTDAPEPGHAILTVADDGPGVPTADRERIWQRFTRLDDARSRDLRSHGSAGSGLGLALVRELAEAHAGTAYVTDADIGGAAFHVRLPLMTHVPHLPQNLPV